MYTMKMISGLPSGIPSSSIASAENALGLNLGTSTSHKMSLAELETKWKDIPDRYYVIIAHILAGQMNDTASMDSFNDPMLKASIKSTFWIYLTIYSILAMCGACMNIGLIYYIIYNRLYKDTTHGFLLNLCFCYVIQCLLVLPISLMVMVVQNWLFGQFLCYFLPMLQDIPIHVAISTYILIVWDRLRWIREPLNRRLPTFVCCCATWLTGMVIALPYSIYTFYIDLGEYLPNFNGLGLCVINVMDDMNEYTRCLFLFMYCAPTILVAYLYIKTAQELHPPEDVFEIMMYESRADVRRRQRDTLALERSRNREARANSTAANAAQQQPNNNACVGTLNRQVRCSFDLYSAELYITEENRKQRNFGSMTAAQTICLCPLMILRFARLSIEETYENMKQIDITFLIFVWFAFLPTVIYPCIYAVKVLPKEEQKRLRGYLRLSIGSSSNSRTHRSDNNGNTADGVESLKETNWGANSTDGPNFVCTTSFMGNAPSSSVDSDSTLNNATTTLASSRTCRSNASSSDCHASMPSNLSRRDKTRTPVSKPLSGRGAADAGAVNNLGKDMHGRKQDVKVNIFFNGHGTDNATNAGGKRSKKSDSAANLGSSASASGTDSPRSHAAAHKNRQGSRASTPAQRELIIGSRENNFCSSMTISSKSGNFLDDSSTSNYGDGEGSSIVSGMFAANASTQFPRWNADIRQKNVSFSELSNSISQLDTSSNLERDLEIIDMLERKRSMDLQEISVNEKHCEKKRPSAERRLLPDINKIIAQRSPKSQAKHNADIYTDMSGDHDDQQMISVPYGEDPLTAIQQTGKEMPTEQCFIQHANKGNDEVPPGDFYDDYTPGSSMHLPPAIPVAPPPPPPSVQYLKSSAVVNGTNPLQSPNRTTDGQLNYQYQYTRRVNRKSSAGHHNIGAGIAGSHRSSKRDSFNSLNGNELIAGAFGELDPAQMSTIEGRMRRSSPRQSNFSGTSSRSLKSRDYENGSAHSTHPDLDFRENIFAEL